MDASMGTMGTATAGGATHTVLDHVGVARLFRLQRLAPAEAGGLWVKWERANPGGSAEDRPARHIVDVAEQRGLLRPGGTIVEDSSGDFGVSLAMVGAARGYRVIVVVGPEASGSTRAALRAFGAEVVVAGAGGAARAGTRGGAEVGGSVGSVGSAGSAGSVGSVGAASSAGAAGAADGAGSAGSTGVAGATGTAGSTGVARAGLPSESAAAVANRLAREIPGAFRPDRRLSLLDSQAHYLTTAREILEETGGDFDVLVAAVGAGGQLAGLSRRLREQAPHVRVVAADLASASASSGSGRGWIAWNLDLGLIDAAYRVPTADAAGACRALARHEGVLTGPVSGAAALVALREALMAGPRARVVAVLADGGDRHLDTVYDAAWLAGRGLPAEIPTLSEIRARARGVAPVALPSAASRRTVGAQRTAEEPA
ncbi:cysteine synthase family protein [Catenulispora subtropica]|uniref:Tryptophan synthase beta chain-like PALP domain-containing protein n=1 Tax=Catenulispora subtropica TaxID=450798 RepID=A0ABN2SRN9_9ACTN